MNNAQKKQCMGVLGGGAWGSNLIKQFNNCGVLHTICDINQEAIKRYNFEYPHVRTTNKWQNILDNKKITMVCIALPADMHYQFAKEALLADKDTYVEKPITLDVREAEELVQLAKEKNKILMVGHLLHYHPCIEKIKEIIGSGEIGKIKNIVSNRLNLGKFRVQENVLWSFAPHDISVILSLCGDKLPDSVSCNGHSHITQGVHDITNSILKYDDQDIYVNINVNWLNPYKEQCMSIVCEKGLIVFNDVLKEGKLRLYKNYIEWTGSTKPTPNPMKSEGQIIDIDMSESPLYRECLHFIDSCRTRHTPITDGHEGVRVLQVLQGLQDSLVKSGQNIKLIHADVKPNYFIHESAIVDEPNRLSDNVKVWHFSHVCANAEIGESSMIAQGCFIASNSSIGRFCKIQNMVSIWNGVHIKDYVFIGSQTCFTNDRLPLAEFPKHGEYLDTIVENNVSIGTNCSIMCGIRIGHHAFIGCGSTVLKNVPPYAVMVGQPCRQIGTINEAGVITHFKK